MIISNGCLKICQSWLVRIPLWDWKLPIPIVVTIDQRIARYCHLWLHFLPPSRRTAYRWHTVPIFSAPPLWTLHLRPYFRIKCRCKTTHTLAPYRSKGNIFSGSGTSCMCRRWDLWSWASWHGRACSNASFCNFFAWGCAVDWFVPPKLFVLFVSATARILW